MPVVWAILVVLLWLAVLGLIVFMLGLSARLGRIDAGVAAGPPSAAIAGGPAVGTRLTDTARYQRLRDAIGEGPAVLLFLSPDCGPCRQLGVALEAEQSVRKSMFPDGRPRVVVVTEEAGAAVYHARGLIDEIFEDSEKELQAAVDVRGTPFGIALDHDDVVLRAGLVAGPGDVANFIAAANGSKSLTVISSGLTDGRQHIAYRGGG